MKLTKLNLFSPCSTVVFSFAMLLLLSHTASAASIQAGEVSAPSDKATTRMADMDDEPMGSRKAIPLGPADCGTMEIWDYPTAMCMPRTMPGMPMRMLMLHGNGFLTQTAEEGPRGRSATTLPDMFMADLGSSVGDHHYLNLDFMGTLERWAYPMAGYQELLQVGESDSHGSPFIDHQHPHNTPIMGLTFSDTISIGE